MSPYSHKWVSVAIGLALLAGLAAARTRAAAQSDTTTVQVFSRLSVVDVTVTDASGHPIQGLKQSDFSLFEDGKPQPIHNFEEVIEVGVPQLPQLPPHVYTNLQPDAASPAVNILLLDFANEAPVDSSDGPQVSRSVYIQRFVKQAAEKAIEQTPAGTRVMVLSMTNHLRILQSLTSNKEVLEAAIDAAPYDLDGNGDKECVQSDERNRMVLEAFDQLAVDALPIHGRKNLLWFTVGIPSITDPAERPKCLPDYTSGLIKSYGLLNASQVAIYPIDAHGVGRLAGQSGALLSMDAVAQATGGVAFYNTNDIVPAVLKSLDNGANYYSLAYIPPDAKYDGKYHKIDVKVDRPGVTLVYRKGYFADDLSKVDAKTGLTMTVAAPPAPRGDMKAPMSRAFPNAQQILFDVAVQPSTVAPKTGDPPILGTLDEKLKGRRLTRYGFDFVVPLQQIAFSGGAGQTHKAALDFDIAVYDANDTRLTGLSQIVKTTLTDATYQKQLAAKEPIRFFQQIDLPPGQLFVRVGVLDHTTNKYGTLDLPLKVAKPRAAAAP